MRTIKVLLAKAGLDGHETGVRVVARVMRDAGFEVVFTGFFNTPEQIVEAAIQEDVDVIGLSSLSGAHMTLVPEILHLLKERGADDVILICGGMIPEKRLEAFPAAPFCVDCQKKKE